MSYHRNDIFVPLPPILSPGEEDAIIRRLASEEDESARKRLAEGYMRLAAAMAAAYKRENMPAEELFSVGLIGLMKAVRTFDPGAGHGLGAYARRCIENEIRTYLRHVRVIDRHEAYLSDQDTLAKVQEGYAGGKREEEEAERLRRAIQELPPRERLLIALRFLLPYESGGSGQKRRKKPCTQAEAAAALGVSQSYISRWERSVLKKLKSGIVKM